MILHVPHASRSVPAHVRDQFLLSDRELSAELNLLTDAFADELFSCEGAAMVRFPLSRLVVDVERLPDDAMEPMSVVGMGMIYTRTAHGRPLRRALRPEEVEALRLVYDAHHARLSELVAEELARSGTALLIDCHSFPSRPLPCDQDQSTPRPHFCLGTDKDHTPEGLARAIAAELRALGYSVGLNRPYAGTMIPAVFSGADRRVVSIMIEVNRSLYMDEATGAKAGDFGLIKSRMQGLMTLIGELRGAAHASPPALPPGGEYEPAP